MTMLSPPRDIKAGRSTLLSYMITVLIRGPILLWLRVAFWAGPIVLLLAFGAIAAFDWLRPIYNWDLVAYLASAMQSQFANFDDLHRQVFSTLKVGLPQAEYQSIVAGDEYRLHQFTNPNALQSMLGMYDVKWLYVTLLTFLGPIFGWLKAPVIINMAALALLYFSLWAWLSRFKLMTLAPMVVALVLGLGLPDAYRVSTPDFLALALMTSGVLMLDRGRTLIALVPLTLAVLARPDGAAAVCMIALFLIAFQDPRWKLGVALLFLGTGAYFFTKIMSTSPGWWVHLWFSTYQMQNTLEGFAPAFSIQVYVTAFMYNLARAMAENNWLGFYIAAIVAWLWMVSESKSDERIREPRAVLISALIFALAAKFIVFPLHDTRTYLPLLFPMILLIGAQFRLHYSNRSQ